MNKRLAIAGFLILALAPAARSQNVTFHNPAELAKPNGYTHVVTVEHGKLIFVSGQVGADKDGKVDPDFAAQARQAFRNLEIALTSAGAKPADLVKLNYYVVGLTHEKLVILREVRDKFLDKEHPPASTLAGVQQLFREDVQVEIEAEAVIP